MGSTCQAKRPNQVRQNQRQCRFWKTFELSSWMVKHELSAYMQVSAKVGQIKQFRIRSLFHSKDLFFEGCKAIWRLLKREYPQISQIRSLLVLKPMVTWMFLRGGPHVLTPFQVAPPAEHGYSFKFNKQLGCRVQSEPGFSPKMARCL